MVENDSINKNWKYSFLYSSEMELKAYHYSNENQCQKMETLKREKKTFLKDLNKFIYFTLF